MTIHQLRELRERVQEDLLTHFDDMPDRTLRTMCEIIVSNFNRYEGQTNE